MNSQTSSLTELRKKEFNDFKSALNKMGDTLFEDLHTYLLKLKFQDFERFLEKHPDKSIADFFSLRRAECDDLSLTATYQYQHNSKSKNNK